MLDEAQVERLLRDATDGALAPWRAMRFVPAEIAERRGRPIVTGARLLEWSEGPPGDALILRPYGVHHHTLVVGFASATGQGDGERGLRVDRSGIPAVTR